MLEHFYGRSYVCIFAMEHVEVSTVLDSALDSIFHTGLDTATSPPARDQ